MTRAPMAPVINYILNYTEPKIRNTYAKQLHLMHHSYSSRPLTNDKKKYFHSQNRRIDYTRDAEGNEIIEHHPLFELSDAIMSFYKGSKTRIKNSNAQDMNLEAYFSSKGRHFCSGYVSKFKEFHKLSIVGEIIYKSQEDPGKFSLFPIYLWITERKAYSVAKKILEKK